MRTALALLLPLLGSPAAARKMNHLADEKSPYLLQHAGNPVDWYPWGDAAFEKARAEGKPVFLSIGYATCHWCHVMERESFSDPKTAEILNKHYVAIKVDREERPDIDKVYMTAATGIGWGGGWPLSIWMTPDRKPFFGGTYFPPQSRWGQPGFGPLLEQIASSWETRREDIAKDAERIAKALRAHSAMEQESAKPDPAWLARACEALEGSFDKEKGGFRGAPKFPMPGYQGLLLRCWARSGDEKALAMAKKTLDAMAAGGIYDQVGGGFHRYSTDDDWFVPHFEKMLYDNAQLAVNYLEAYQAAKDPEHARIARETLDYVLREMTHKEGGFFSAEDADSLPAELAAKGVPDSGHEHKAEGAYYLWTVEELHAVLGPISEMFAYRYGARPGGNVRHDPHGEFEGKNILFAEHSVAQTAAKFKKSPGETGRALEEARAKLRAARAKRPRPFLDDKVLASWNGLMISAFAKGAQVLDEPGYLAAAEKAARFIRAKLYDAKTKRLHHRWREGHRSVEGLADDYAFMISGLLDLYEASFDTAWLDWAEELADALRADFWDSRGGGFYMTPAGGGKDLLMRVVEDSDGVEPSASSAAALSFLRLAQLTERREFLEGAEKTLERFGGRMREAPQSLAGMLAAVDFAAAKPKQIIIAGELDDPGTREMLRLVHARFIPGKVLVVADETTRPKLAKRIPVLKGMRPIGGKATAYVCVNFACELPTNDLQTVAQILDGKRPAVR